VSERSAPPTLRAIPRARVGRAVVSYTRLAHDRSTGGATAVDAADFDRDDDTPPTAPPPDELPGGAATGLFVHEVLEHVDFAAAFAEPDPEAWGTSPDVAPIVAAAARRHAIDDRYFPHARRLVHATITREIELADRTTLPPLAAAPRRAREIHFVYPLPGPAGRGVVKGVIDLLVEWDDRLWIVDYKTDVLAARTRAAAEARVKDRYDIQARLYGLAAARLVPRQRLGGLLYWFVRDQIVIPLSCGPDRLADWERWLEAVEAVP
jgi:ATP-dependent exoDNAse (exonuclease V) beta subunit